jgi:hypothetical protein
VIPQLKRSLLPVTDAERAKQYRDRQRHAETLKRHVGWELGTRPSEKQRKQIRELVRAGEVEVPEEGFNDGTPWAWYPAREKAVAIVPTQRALVQKRQKAAQKHDVAIGWIDHNGELTQGATRMNGAQPA